ncbi:MAG: MBL fold metallo-hydrolase [Candidatus Harrisonbacteria bacterium]|nr:MBL fold metallo-hydrolase [Candidatus Harrisonbacteria bacterium]
MTLTFHGGAKMVTGANYLLESGGEKILIDCGLHQGSNFCEKHNWENFPYNPAEISAVLITHAHIDHTGRLPKLVKDGFVGKVYSTPPTRDFAREMLLDSEHILLQDAERFRLPALYGVRDIEELMARWEGVEYHKSIKVGKSFTATFYDAGHILGSSFIVVEAENKKVIFSGDLGNSPAPIINARENLTEGATHCLVESTYGGRIHEPIKEREGVIKSLIEETIKNGGTLMIPAFAMERTQHLLFDINNLAESGRIPKIPIFLDSPLAIKLTEIYKKHSKYFNKEAQDQLRGGDAIFSFPGLKLTMTTEESKAINDVPSPKVIIAGAGMSTAGRILHHEKRYLPDPKSTLLIVGFQARGSLGRQILDGKKSGKPFNVRIHGEDVPVRCNIKAIGSFSAHADQPQLLDWIKPMKATLKKVFTVQGEEDQAMILAKKISDQFGIDAKVPDEGMAEEL